jgi:hypothetical protein
MITVRLTADINADRRVVLALPPELPAGHADLVVTVESPHPKDKRARTSLAAWADANAESWGVTELNVAATAALGS